MIEEALISFETAKIAKEKSIELPHTHFYVLEFSTFKANKTVQRNSLPNDNSENFLQIVKNRKGQPHIAPAYSQSILQKWLREVHGIYVESYHDLKFNFQGVQYYTNWGFIRNPEHDKIHYGGQRAGGGYDEFNEWKTYEESLEYGLQQALKMI